MKLNNQLNIAAAINIKNIKRFVVLVISTAIMYQSQAADSSSFSGNKTTISQIAYFGYQDTIQLANQTTKVIIAPSIGGKILEYSLNGENTLVLKPSEAGWLYQQDPERTKLPMNSAGRFDIGPSKLRVNRDNLYLGVWQTEIISPNSVKVTSIQDPNTGLQLARTYTLLDGSSQLNIKHTITNVSDSTIPAFIWTRTLASGKGIFVIPIESEQCLFYPQCYAQKKGPWLTLAPESDPAIIKTPDSLMIKPTPKLAKFGIESDAGWFAYLMPNHIAMIREFEVDKNGHYPDLYSGMVSLYYNDNYQGHAVAELEPISPLVHLQPSQTSEFNEVWQLVSYPFPTHENAIDGDKILNKLGSFRVTKP